MKEIVLNNLKLIYAFIKQKILILTEGKGNFKLMLYGWGIAPAVFVLFFCQTKINFYKNNFFIFLIEVFLSTYFFWHVYVIRKTLKVQPENKVVKLKKKDLYKDKTDDEIKELKKERNKEFIQKLLLQKGWSTTPNYVIVGCIDVYVAWTELQLALTFLRIL